MKKVKNQSVKVLYNKLFFVILVLLGLNNISFSTVCFAQFENQDEYIKKAKEYYKQENWKQAAWYYNRYLEHSKKVDSLYVESLYTLADIYYLHLKRYVPALEIYTKLINLVSDKKIKNRIAQLNTDRDNDGFVFAQEHDLGLLDNVPILNEVDKLIPQNYSITYVKKGGFGGGIIKKLRFVKNNKEVYIYNGEDEKDRKELALKDFLRILANLILVEPEDIPDEDTIYYEIKDKQVLPKPESSLVADATSVEIILASDDKIRKIFIIDPLELSSERLQKIVNSLDEVIVKKE